MINFTYIYDCSYESNRKIRPHRHSCYELIYYFDGDGISNYDKSEIKSITELHQRYNYMALKDAKDKFKIEKNTMLMYLPNILHDEVHIKPSSIFAIGFNMENEKFIVKTEQLKDYNLVYYSIIKRIQKEYSTKLFNYEIIINNLLYELLTYISRKKNAINSENNHIKEILNYINENYTSDLNLDKLASLAGYTTDHFRFLFKTETGLSPKRYILTKRLEYAKQLLKYTDLQIQKITTSTGFSYSGQFSNFFKEFEGISPSEYRTINKGKPI